MEEKEEEVENKGNKNKNRSNSSVKGQHQHKRLTQGRKWVAFGEKGSTKKLMQPCAYTPMDDHSRRWESTSTRSSRMELLVVPAIQTAHIAPCVRHTTT